MVTSCCDCFEGNNVGAEMENNGEEVTFLDRTVREGLLEFSEEFTSELMPKGCRRA